MVDHSLISELNNGADPSDLVKLLKNVAGKFACKAIFTTSFGIEDQVITDIIFNNNIDIKVITLDTGRFFEETYKVFNRTIDRYGKSIEVYFPKHETVEKMITEKGPLSFYLSFENRKECCHIRKVEPLGRALKGMECWITGIRAAQSENRHDLHFFEWDNGYQLVKFNPLLKWSLEDCQKYVRGNNVPYNVLHDKGFVSIGCAPCTRAIGPGEDFRAGRWWWENNSKKECGLHTHEE
jgi:phosphoadenosine phosphosulfate reductase